MVTFVQSGIGAIKRSLQEKLGESLSVADFGAKGDGVTSDALAFQRACDYAHSIGGARIHVPTPKVAWLIDYPVFLRNGTELAGTGVSCKIIFKNPSYAKGRGGFVIGSSLEANRDTALAAYAAGTYPAASMRNNAYVNPNLKQYLRDNPAKAEAKDSCIHDVYIIAQFDSPTDWGGYGINFVNAWNCHAYRIWGKGWTQLIGMGSDVVPETPSNYACTAKELYVMEPDLVHTYYSVGFMANSTDCEISRARQYVAIPAGTTDGNGVATNFCERCTIRDINIPKLGRSTNSQGVFLNNSKGCVVDEIYVGDAKMAMATFYTDNSYNDPAMRNKVGPTIVGDSCDQVVNLGAKYTSVLGYVNVASTTDVAFLNSNATNNAVSGPNNVVSTPSDQPRRAYFTSNTLAGWTPRAIYFRPVDLLVNDKSADVLSYNALKTVQAKAGIDLNLLWRVPEYVRAIGGATVYLTYADNASVAGSTTTVSVRRMVGFNGNAGEAPYVESTATHSASNTATTDLSYGLSGLFVENADTSHGLGFSMDVLITLKAPTQYSSLKEVKVEYFG